MSHNESRSAHYGDLESLTDHDFLPVDADRWSTWSASTHGPVPRPDWVITDNDTHDTELGILKTGKEADVHLIRRTSPSTSVLLAAKRFRSAERRMFHRDSGYLEGRRVRRSREMRAMARRTGFGRELITGQWLGAEFSALCRAWELVLPVPYPVSTDGTELLMEFIGDDDGVAAPRLAAARASSGELGELFDQIRDAMIRLAAAGWAHGDLSAYNILVHDGRAIIIDWPQIVDIVGNPHGVEFLQRDADNLCTWFTARGINADAGQLVGELVGAAFGSW